MDPKVYDDFSQQIKLNLSTFLPPLEALENPYRTVLDIIYTLTAVMAFLLNIFALTVILKTKGMSVEMKKYLSNLAFVDILISLSIMLVYTDFMYGRWMFSPIMCPIYNFVSTTTVFVNIYILVAIGFWRYVAVMNPFSTITLLEEQTNKILLSIWITGMLLASPLLYQARVVEFSYGNLTYHACQERWAGDLSSKIYTIIVFKLFFIIPLILLVFLYGSIAYRMFKRKAPGNTDQRRDQAQNLQTIKLIKIIIILITAFAICWFPLQLFNLIFWVFNSERIYYSKAYYYVYTCTFFLCHWLSAANSFVNPIIYCVMSKNFKWKVVCKLFHRKRSRCDTSNKSRIWCKLTLFSNKISPESSQDSRENGFGRISLLGNNSI